MTNPFTPTFGIVPPYLAGRTVLLNDMRRAFANGLGDPNLCSIIIGPRGSGKTALLSCIGKEASDNGWVAADTVAADGMLEDILQRAVNASADIMPRRSGKKLTGVTVGQLFALEWTTEQPEKENWRSRMTTLLKELQKNHSGLLITVDEVRADIPEMITLASIYQLLIRDGLPVGLVMAGLSTQVNDLLDDKSSSFLRRARQHILERLSDGEVRRAFRKTVESSGKKIGETALEEAVEAIEGFPYMMQLVGYSVWEESGQKKLIDGRAVREGIQVAEEEFSNGVLRSTFRELSGQDVAFLKAMLPDEEYSRITDIAARMKQTSGYASTYKSRLLKAGVVEENINGTVSFAMPAFRRYLENMV